MTPHHVNSKQHMLSNNDILLVSAHDHPESAEKAYKKAGSPAQATPELLMYTIFNQLFVQPNVIRLREGNTLFTLTPGEKETVMLMFDADTPGNTVNNIAEFFKASQKMGFKKLIGQSEKPIINKMIRRAFEKLSIKNKSLEIKDNYIVLEFKNV
jgi:hypothetical protein